MPYYSFVLLCYNNWELTKQAITTLVQSINHFHKEKGIEIIVVNNGSVDSTKENIEKIKYIFKDELEIIPLHLKENMGYPVGINIGLSKCRGKIITILNNDLIFPEGWFDGLISSLENDRSIGAAVPFLTHAHGLQHCDATFKSLEEMRSFAEKFMEGNKDKVIYTYRVIGACVVLKRDVLDLIGGNDFWFTLGHFDDDDLSLRICISGYKLIIVGASFVHHLSSATFNQNLPKIRAAHQANLLKFSSKWKQSGLNYTMRNEIVEQIKYSRCDHYFPLSRLNFTKPKLLNKDIQSERNIQMIMVADWMNSSSCWKQKLSEVKELLQTEGNQLYIWLPRNYFSEKDAMIVQLEITEILGEEKLRVKYLFENIYPINILTFLCRYDVFLSVEDDYINRYFKYLLENTSLRIR